MTSTFKKEKLRGGLSTEFSSFDDFTHSRDECLTREGDIVDTIGLLPHSYCRRSKCGRARIQFDPVIEFSKPFLCFINGNCCHHALTCEEAEVYLTAEGYRF